MAKIWVNIKEEADKKAKELLDEILRPMELMNLRRKLAYLLWQMDLELAEISVASTEEEDYAHSFVWDALHSEYKRLISGLKED